MDILRLVENESTSEFYPTPESVIDKMLTGIDFRSKCKILEPSAGKGDILKAIAKKSKNIDKWGENTGNNAHISIDCIEYDENLRQILKHQFSGEREDSLRHRYRELANKGNYSLTKKEWNNLTGEENIEIKSIQQELRCFFDNGIHIVHDDFLTFEPYSIYDLIIMNPPFSNGDKHLLKALDIQKNGGNIVCLLNAETIKNPYTPTRQTLQRKLEEYNAEIEFIQNGFATAERKTDVEIALVRISIPAVRKDSEIFERLKKAEDYKEFIPQEGKELEVTDFIEMTVNRFNVEAKAGITLINEYRALSKYISADFKENGCLLSLNLGINEFMEALRMKYWEALLSNPKFVGKLTSKLQEEYRRKIDTLKNYDFTKFNIHSLTTEINSQVKSGIEEEIVKMYDRLTTEHSWYPETKNNKHYYDGWKTNIAHKIGKKVIIPCHGIFSQWDGRPNVYEAKSVLEDIERCLNFLDGHMTKEVNLQDVIQENFKNGITKNVELKYFKATFYKKGTVHLVFTNPELIERFNIYVAKGKNWLPPNYGKKSYRDLDTQERKVVDSFQGEKEYNKILQNSGYYLAPATNGNMLALEG